jgi:hypothetical protein
MYVVISEYLSRRRMKVLLRTGTIHGASRELSIIQKYAKMACNLNGESHDYLH